MPITREINQSIFDIAIQHSGSVESAFDIAIENNLSVTDESTTDVLSPVILDQRMVEKYKADRHLPATGNTDFDNEEGINFWAIELDFIIQ